MPTGVEYERRIGDYFVFIDEMLELFKGQLSYDDITRKSYKELILLRNARVSRLKAEKEAIDKGDERAKNAAMSRQFEEMVMNMR